MPDIIARPRLLAEDSILARPFLAAPRTLDWAAWFMRFGALLALLSGVAAVITLGLSSDELPGVATPESPGDFARAKFQLQAIYLGVYCGISALWLITSCYLQHGRAWARIFGTVLASIVLTWLSLSMAFSDSPESYVSYSVGAVTSSMTVILLWLPPSNKFYRKKRELRAQR